MSTPKSFSELRRINIDRDGDAVGYGPLHLQGRCIYLANAYSSKDPIRGELIKMQRRALESYTAMRLKQLYAVTVILPIAISAAMVDMGIGGDGFDNWAMDDYNFILRCDEVWVLKSDGWKESVGVQAEIKFANFHGIPVRYINPKTFKVGYK